VSTTSSKFNAIPSFLSKAKESIGQSNRNIVVIAIFAAIVSAIIVLLLWSSGDNYRPLYSSSSNYDTSNILQLLDENNVEYTLSADDGEILVPEKNVAKTRMLLAAKGLKEQLPIGFDSLNTGTASLGESQFMETARYRHALEGELSRSITTMDQINLARVHLAIPKVTLFARKDTERPRASVIINVLDGVDINRYQVDSIINLVSGAVIGLKEENVKVVDQYGRLLSDEANNGDYTRASSKQRDYKSDIEKKLVTQAGDILTPILGAANFRVQISSDIDFSKREETRQSYGEPTLLSESITSDKKDLSLAFGIPGSLSNTPPATDNDEQPDSDKSTVNSSVDKKYQVGSTVEHILHQQSISNKITIAVVINDEVKNGGVWTAEELEKIKSVVIPAVGFNAERGDTISIQSFSFISSDFSAVQEEPSLSSILGIENPVRNLITLILGMLLIIFVLRPIVNFLTKEHTNNQLALAVDEDVLEPEKAREKSLQSKMEALGIDSDGIKAVEDDLPSADSPIEVQIQHLKLIAAQDPERVTEILRTWMQA